MRSFARAASQAGSATVLMRATAGVGAWDLPLPGEHADLQAEPCFRSISGEHIYDPFALFAPVNLQQLVTVRDLHNTGPRRTAPAGPQFVSTAFSNGLTCLTTGNRIVVSLLDCESPPHHPPGISHAALIIQPTHQDQRTVHSSAVRHRTVRFLRATKPRSENSTACRVHHVLGS